MRRALLGFLLLPTLLLARQKVQVTAPGDDLPFIPWLTGPLLAPTAVIMKPGHPSIEGAVTISNTFGRYDSNWQLRTGNNFWGINFLLDFQFGITDNFGIEVLPGILTNIRDSKSATHFQDTFLLIGYQVAWDKKNSWIPDFRLDLQITFPTGKHDKFSPDKLPLESTGQGAYFFGPNLAFQKLFYLPCNFFMLHWSIGYFFPTEAKIKGISAYGGTPETRGRIRPGQFLLAYLSGEYSFNQRWVFAFDTQFWYQGATSSFRGKSPSPSPHLPSSFQLSFAPQIEYNFSERAGIVSGLWGTLAGYNAEAFASVFIAYVYTF